MASAATVRRAARHRATAAINRAAVNHVATSLAATNRAVISHVAINRAVVNQVAISHAVVVRRATAAHAANAAARPIPVVTIAATVSAAANHAHGALIRVQALPQRHQPAIRTRAICV